MKKIFQSNPLFLAIFLPIVVDVVGTVFGQPSEYWSSKGEVFNEAVPFISKLLQIHPLLFIVFCLSFWLPVTYWLLTKLKYPTNIWATTSLLIGHGYNSVSWLRKDLYQAGLFTGTDQTSKALSLIPMSIYILLIGWVAARGLFLYFQPYQSIGSSPKRLK